MKCTVIVVTLMRVLTEQSGHLHGHQQTKLSGALVTFYSTVPALNIIKGPLYISHSMTQCEDRAYPCEL